MVVIREQRYIEGKVRTCYVDDKTNEIVGPYDIVDILNKKKKNVVDTSKGQLEIVSNEDILRPGHVAKIKDEKGKDEEGENNGEQRLEKGENNGKQRLEKGEVDLEKELKKAGWLKDKPKQYIKKTLIPKPGDFDYDAYLVIERDKKLADPIKYWKEKEEAEAEAKAKTDNKRLVTAVDNSKVIKEDKVEERSRKPELAVTPKIPIPDINIMATTNTGTASPSGTATITPATITPDIKFNVPVPKIDLGIDIDKLKDKENKKIDKKIEVKADNDKTKEKKEETDPYNWYINENLRLKK